MCTSNDVLNTTHGTLIIALATPKFIVVTSDSRKSANNGFFEDNSKKLFKVGNNKALAIAGLCGAWIPKAPWITAQISTLLERGLDLSYSNDALSMIEDRHWNDIPLHKEIPEDFEKRLENYRYIWWSCLDGPIQTITNILATYEDVDLNRFFLMGILAGFKENGEAKIECLYMVPQQGTSSWGLPWVGIARANDKKNTNKSLIWQTAGQSPLADIILGESAPDEVSNSPVFNKVLEHAEKKYSGIKNFKKRRETKTVDNISEEEMIELAKDLILATAEITSKVGGPIQIATIRPNNSVDLQQPSFPESDICLPLDGTWHMGVKFTPEYPFNEGKKNVVFTNCEIINNHSPIPLGDNFFENATFIYDGGQINFDNNKERDSKLIVGSDKDDSSISSILNFFSQVERIKN